MRVRVCVNMGVCEYGCFLVRVCESESVCEGVYEGVGQ